MEVIKIFLLNVKMVFCSDLLCEKNVLVSKKPNFSELSVMNYNHSMNNSWIFLLFWQKYVPNSKNFNFSGSLRPKPGFGIGPRNQGPISVSEPIFFPETLKKKNLSSFQLFSFSPTFWRDTSSYKLENKPRSSKMI